MQVRRLAVLLLVAIGFGGAPATGDETAPAEPQKPEMLPPPPHILDLMKTNDAENHLEAFRAWHNWRSGLSRKQKRAANRFLAREEWYEVLGNEALYDFRGRRRRLSGFKLLKRLSGQKRFPYFLWGMGDPEAIMAEPMAFGGLFAKYLNQSEYIKAFFKRYGDPTVLDELPDFGWWDVKAAITKRWRDKEPPERTWQPFVVENFVRDLSSDSAVRCRLAIRALTANARCGGISSEGRFRRLLLSSDHSIKLLAARALTVTQCPDARGLLQEIAESHATSTELRRACLLAIVNCGKARRWSAEWMLDFSEEWPPEIDETVQECLVRLCPEKDDPDRLIYESFLERWMRNAKSERVKRIVKHALEELA